MKRSPLTRKTPLRGKAQPRPLAVEALPQIVPALSVPPAPVVVSSEPRAVGPVLEKPPQLVSPRYLAAVREMTCAFCWPGRAPSEPHHFPARGSRGRNDLLVVAVCRHHHEAAHSGALSQQALAAAVHETQVRLFEQRGALWWLGVMREIAAGLDG